MKRNILFCVICAAAAIADAPAAQPTIYWTETLGGIQRGIAFEQSSIQVVVPSLGNPQAVTLDRDGGKMYWTDDVANNIGCANLDGTNVQVLVSGIEGPKGIAIDHSGGMMYWVDNYRNRIQRSHLDGSDVDDIIGYATEAYLGGVALDLAASKVYWAENFTGFSGRILRANLDGTYPEIVLSSSSHGPDWLALDPTTHDIFWASEVSDTILRNDMPIVTGIHYVGGVAVDAVERKVYWASKGDGKISRANLDGTSVEDVLVGLSYPFGIALHVVPEPATAVMLGTGFAALGTLLCCRRLAQRHSASR